MLNALAERQFPVGKLSLLASQRSAGSTLEWAGQSHVVQEANAEAFAGVDIALMSAGSAASRELAPQAAAQGAVVIDNSSAFRQEPDVPLVVPEVNGHLIRQVPARRIIANPNCATIQMVVALAPLHRQAPLQKLVVSTYQAVSGAGQKGISELGEQVAALFNQTEFTPKVFPRRIAFNCLPHIDVFVAGETGEELKISQETRKILAIDGLPITATCVRVPVFNGHAVSLYGEFAAPIPAARAQELLRTAQGVLLMDDPQEGVYPTPVDAEGQDATLVGRVRNAGGSDRALALWCVADNLRKGAATNAVQIAEIVSGALGERR
jgi:aspartate-semialdehyde dehydrogenase